MDNQSGQPQYAMTEQGFRPFPALMSAPSTTQQHAGSSSSTAVIQVAGLPSHTDHGNIGLVDDGYHWRMCSQNVIQGALCPMTFYYQCAHANCEVQKSVARSVDGQTTQILCMGVHNHQRPRRSVRWQGDVSERPEPMSQVSVLTEASDAAGAAAGPSGSGPETRNGNNDQTSGSSDSDEDDDGDVRVDGDAAAVDANAVVQRHVAAPIQGNSSQTASEVDILDHRTHHENSDPRKKRRLKSKVWDEFKRIFDNDGNLQSAECIHCENSLVAETSKGTSHLRRHLKSCTAKAGTSGVQQKQKSSITQLDLPVSKNSKYGQENPLEEFMRAMVPKLCPFSAMYSASFAPFLAGRHPAPNMVPQITVEEKFIGVYENEKMKLKEKIIATPGGVFLSLDKWHLDDSIEANIVCLTVHFIDEGWKINRKTIRCCFSELEMYCSSLFDLHWQSEFTYDEDYDGMVLKEVVRDWCLEQKLLGVTLHPSVDNKVILSLEDDLTGRNHLLSKCNLLTIPCMVYALNDLMGIGWNNIMIFSSFYMTSSPERKQKYQEILPQLHLHCPSFGSERWYSTFYLCEAALQFIKSYPLPDPYLSLYDLEAIENFCKIARPIYRAMKAVSDPYNVTFNSFFHVMWSLRETLQELPSIKNIEKVFEVEIMQKKFDNCWKKWYLWPSIAVVLDPRYKLAFVELHFREAFRQDAGIYISEVRAKLYELYIQYCYVNEQSNEILNQGNNGLYTQISAPLHNQRTNYTIAQAALEEFKELYEYLGGGLCPQNDYFDILKWWRDNSSTYPTLAKMARDILAIPGCAGSAESAFDGCDQREELFKGKFRPKTAEALICAENWIKSPGTADADNGNNITLS